MSEFRQDPVSGDWIVIAPGRAKRPRDFRRQRKPRFIMPVRHCPFHNHNIKKSGNWPPILRYPAEGPWQVLVLPNKYPALSHDRVCALSHRVGPYITEDGVGYHDLVVTRDHQKNFAELLLPQALAVFKILQERYRKLAIDPCVLYASSFMNWGISAGASLSHPHYHVLALPIVPPDVGHSLHGSARYFRIHRRCVHCAMLRYERQSGKRIIAENSRAVALAPFVSRLPYEIRIFPKHHLPYFEKTGAGDLRAISNLFQVALRKMKRALGDPDFNFFIHTAPLKRQDRYQYYHWHIEIIPKISILGGFELSTGVDINTVSPDEAARLLRRR